jgi:hypothetical protein
MSRRFALVGGISLAMAFAAGACEPRESGRDTTVRIRTGTDTVRDTVRDTIRDTIRDTVRDTTR